MRPKAAISDQSSNILRQKDVFCFKSRGGSGEREENSEQREVRKSKSVFPLLLQGIFPLCYWPKIGLCCGIKPLDAENGCGASSVATATYL